MAKAHDRILVIAITCDESADSVVTTSVRYYRDRAKLAASDYETIDASFSAASATVHEITFNQILPPPTHIRIVPTFQA